MKRASLPHSIHPFVLYAQCVWGGKLDIVPTRNNTKKLIDVDGAFFGTTFPNLFFLVFPELKPEKSGEHYTPRLFGFKLHESWRARSLEASRKAQKEYVSRQKSKAGAKPAIVGGAGTLKSASKQTKT